MMKTLLLASAAGLSVVSLAQAADVPMDKAEAVEYVKVCSEFGTGFFYIPGTDTCLQISGYVHATAAYTSEDYTDARSPSEDGTYDSFDMKSEAQVNFDARTATEYGTLRSVISIRGNATNGDNGSAYVHNAYLQLGGFAAGYNTSAFTYFDNVAPTVLESYYSPGTVTNFFSYTATFGGGFFATASVESREPRANDYYSPDTNTPDFVGVVGVKQGWGDFQVMGAVHQATDGSSSNYDTKTGFAVGAGATVNLGMAGATLYLEGLYADGALSYLGSDYGYDVSDTGESSTGYALSAALSAAVSPNMTVAVTGSMRHTEGDGYYSSSYSWDDDVYAIGGTVTYTVTKGFTVAASVGYSSDETDVEYLGSSHENYQSDTWTAGIRVKRSF